MRPDDAMDTDASLSMTYSVVMRRTGDDEWPVLRGDGPGTRYFVTVVEVIVRVTVNERGKPGFTASAPFAKEGHRIRADGTLGAMIGQGYAFRGETANRFEATAIAAATTEFVGFIAAQCTDEITDDDLSLMSDLVDVALRQDVFSGTSVEIAQAERISRKIRRILQKGDGDDGTGIDTV